MLLAVSNAMPSPTRLMHSKPFELPYLVLVPAGDPRPISLARRGLNVVVAHDIESCFRTLAARRFAGVIVDVALQGEDTLTFVTALRGHGATQGLTIVAIGCTTTTSKSIARECGADVVLSALPSPKAPKKRSIPAPDESGVFATVDSNVRLPQEKRRPPEGARLDHFSLSYASRGL